MKGNTPLAQPTIPSRLLALLCLAIGVSGVGYAILLNLSWKFASERLAEDRPTLMVLLVFGGLFLVYWISLWMALRMPSSRVLAIGIFATSALFRGILLPSIPIHEIDIYRYLWDGAVFAEGVSPYRYAPGQVLTAANEGGAPHDATLQQLVELQAGSGSLNESLNTIHYGHFPSPYPIVSQAVFAVSAIVTPDGVTAHGRLVIMKSLLVLMDLATLLAVIMLLREVGMHVGWSIAYGWCPLVMKEIANGGHLDSIAIFLSTLAIWLLVRSARDQAAIWPTVSAATALALSIGAKLYPVVLVPLFAAVWLRQFGWKTAAVGIATTGLLSGLLLYPLLGPGEKSEPIASVAEMEASATDLGQVDEPATSTQASVETDEGIKAFLEQWEMNDLLFMLVLENIRPQSETPADRKPWFVVTSDEWAKSMVTRWASLKGATNNATQEESEPLTVTQFRRESFALARVITGGAFFIFACLIAWIAGGKTDPHHWCRAAMLTLAWFWLSCPTQNPWYWCWVVPLLPFARGRTWHIVAAVTMLYYLRFWLMTHYPEPSVLSTPYNGAYFFYFVVAWIEFLPVLIGLAIEPLFSPGIIRNELAEDRNER